ncbi:ribosomal protein L7/L12 [Streptomyces sp. Da 82-17]|uniref:ribosomal protein L7/L12 n=1 Tax=Streptomyces sp. Da 82-17 TaxID=3377116 RepID=UPI0038D4AE97
MEIAIFVLAFGVLVVVGTLENKIKRVDSRVARVERKLDLVIEHLGVDAGALAPDLGRVRALVAEGKQVQAIKEYRQLTGVGLKEAKDEVERLTATR